MIIKGQKVLVHRNLKNGMLSVLNANTGLLITHVDTIELEDCTFIVHQSGYDLFKKTGQKNVHAYVKGTVVNFNKKTSSIDHLNYIYVYYNPKVTNFFYSEYVSEIDNKRIKHCSKCIIDFYGNIKVITTPKTLLLDFFDFIYECEILRGKKVFRIICDKSKSNKFVHSIKEFEYVTVHNNCKETYLEFKLVGDSNIYSSGLTKKETTFIKNICTRSKYWIKL